MRQEKQEFMNKYGDVFIGLPQKGNIQKYLSSIVFETIDDIIYMQTFGELVSTDLQSVKNSMIKNTIYTLKDARDEQEYTVAKLEDNKIWMTKNLNLAGGTEITAGLSDIPENYTLPTANGFQEGNKLPTSSQEGFSDNTQAYVYNSNNGISGCSISSGLGCYSYYSWNAATAGSGVNITTGNIDAQYSICPKGWRLPNSRNTTAGNSDFYKLAIAYGMNPNTVTDNGTETSPIFYKQAGPNTTPDFITAGVYKNNSRIRNGNGYYWSSTSHNNTYAKNLDFYFSGINSAGQNPRMEGYSVRCLAK